MIEQRLYSYSVAAHKKPSRVFLKYREGKYPVKLFRTGFLIVAVCLQQDLRIAAGAESESRFLKLIPEFVRIIQLPVIYDRELFTLIQGAHRLLTVLRIDNAEPPVQQRRVPSDVFSVFVRTAPPERFRHAHQQSMILSEIPVII